MPTPTCPICHKTFKTVRDMIRHYQNQHRAVERANEREIFASIRKKPES